MRPQHLAITLLFTAHVATTSAEVPDEQRHEVEHLLNFVASTSCIINRNGSLHTGPEALSHIRKKYTYFRDKITSTEKFIELAASKSTLSGNVYTVQCKDRKVITTQEWLFEELYKLRRTHDI